LNCCVQIFQTFLVLDQISRGKRPVFSLCRCPWLQIHLCLFSHSIKYHAEVTDTPTSGIKESVSLRKQAGDKTNWLGERNLAKEITGNNIVSLATQLLQNQNKIFPGKVIVQIFILESFVLPSVYKFFLQTKTQTSSIQAKSHFFKSSPA